MKRRVCAAWLLLLLAAQAAVVCQEKGDGGARKTGPPAFVRVGDVGGEAARLLGSAVSAERAWGAYLAGIHGLRGQEEALVRVLTDPALGDGWEHTLVRQSALDALIRLDAKVPTDVLRALPPGHFAAEALILMSIAPEENGPLLLDVFAAQDGFEGRAGAHWLAAGNLLARTKAQGFAAQLLKHLKVEAYIVVLDGEEERGFGWGGGNGCGCCGLYEPPEDFPPMSFYGLTTDLLRGAVVVAPGRHPVYYVSSDAPGGGACSFDEPADKDTVRVEYLAALLDTHEEELELDARPRLTVVCKDERQCRRELARVRGRIVRAYLGAVRRLVGEGLLGGAGDAPPAPAIAFTLRDERRHKTYPLPTSLRGVEILCEKTGDEPPAEEAGP